MFERSHFGGMASDQRRADEQAAFMSLAEGGSFVAAAALLRRHPTIVSKRVAALELRLGVRLVERTTRRLNLTDAGARLAERLRSASDAIDDAEQEAAAEGADLRGRLRLAFPAAMRRRWLAPVMPEFAKLYPGLEIEVEYSERHVDLIGERFDAAIRLGALVDSRLVSRRLGEHRLVLGASPAYLSKAGMPASPAELVGHNLLRYTGPVSTSEWRLVRGSSRASILPGGNFASNDIDALVDAARQDLGIIGFGEWSMARDFTAGTLTRVLPDWRFSTEGEIHLLRPSAAFTPRRVGAFADWIATLFSDGPPWRKPG